MADRNVQAFLRREAEIGQAQAHVRNLSEATHLVYSDGDPAFYQEALQLKLRIVKKAWIDECEEEKARLDEEKFTAASPPGVVAPPSAGGASSRSRSRSAAEAASRSTASATAAGSARTTTTRTSTERTMTTSTGPRRTTASAPSGGPCSAGTQK